MSTLSPLRSHAARALLDRFMAQAAEEAETSVSVLMTAEGTPPGRSLDGAGRDNRTAFEAAGTVVTDDGHGAGVKFRMR